MPVTTQSAALTLVEAVRSDDAVTVRRVLSRPDLPRIAADLAGFLALYTPAPLRPHGTHAAFTRHRNHDEQPCTECQAGERTYQRNRKRKQRAGSQLPLLAVAPHPETTGEETMHKDGSVDSVSVDRFIAGDDTVTLNRAEKACAYRKMLRLGVPRSQVVARLRISWTTAQSFAPQYVENQLHSIVAGGQNDSEAEQRANATRPLTDTPAYPGGRLMPSIAAHHPDSCQQVAG